MVVCLFVPFFWPLCCLFFFDIRIRIAPFVSSDSSCIFEYFSKWKCNIYIYIYKYILWILIHKAELQILVQSGILITLAKTDRQTITMRRYFMNIYRLVGSEDGRRSFIYWLLWRVLGCLVQKPCRPVNCIGGYCYPGNGSWVWDCNPYVILTPVYVQTVV